MGQLRFSWDTRKARSNERKHGVSFEEAETVFLDDNALLLDDPDHSWDEKRFVLLGLSSSLRVLLVCHCFLDEDTVRLISARRASKQERRQYAERFEE
ncbi:MAG: BrnT family toxin [Acidobacteria bacterium]|nr:MAG: BrnT family toxin [Acidobacteriota bacterium]